MSDVLIYLQIALALVLNIKFCRHIFGISYFGWNYFGDFLGLTKVSYFRLNSNRYMSENMVYQVVSSLKNKSVHPAINSIVHPA